MNTTVRRTLSTSVAVLIAGLLFAVAPVAVTAQETLLRVDGTLGPGDQQRDDGAWEDTYQFRVAAGETVEVIAASEDFDSFVTATFPDGTTLENDDYFGLNAGFVRRVSTGGLVTVRVSPLFAEGAGAYRLTAVALAPATPLRVGTSYEGEFRARGAVDGRLTQMFVLEGRAGERITIDMTTDGFVPAIEAVDDDGRSLYSYPAGDRAARIAYLFDESGTLMVTATSLGGTDVGAWTISTRESSRSVLAQYSGTITNTTERAFDGTPYERHIFDGEPGAIVEVVLESANFDTVLWVSDSRGISLARNDDSGTGTDSLVVVAVPADGTLHLFATPFWEGSGAYRLIVYGE